MRRFEMGPALAAVGLASIALVSFVLHARHDRGGFVDEAIPFRQALTLWGWGDSPPTLNPHFFSYPSLSIYFHALVQAVAVLVGKVTGRYISSADAGVEYFLDPTYLVTIARLALVLVVLLAGALAGSWWHGRSTLAAILCGLAVVTTPMLLRAWLQMPPEVLMVPCTIGLVSVLGRRAAGSLRGDVAAGVCAGVLLSLKYSALPCLSVAIALRWRRGAEAGRGPGAALTVCVSAVAVALLGTPYALLDLPAFLKGVSFEWWHLIGGHLGAGRASTFVAHARQLFDSMGAGLPLCLLLFATNRGARTARSWIVLLMFLSFAGPAMAAASGGPEHYLVPIAPLAWLFLSEVVFQARGSARRSMRIAGSCLLVLGAMQVGFNAWRVLRPTGAAPSAQAAAWFREHARPDAIVAQDHGATALFSTDRRAEMERSSCLRHASPRWVERARDQAALTVVDLPLVTAGPVEALVRGPAGEAHVVKVIEPGWSLSPPMFDMLRTVRVDYFVANSALEQRIEIAAGLRAGALLQRSGAGEILAVCAERQGSVLGQPPLTIRLGSGVSQPLPAHWWVDREREVSDVTPSLMTMMSAREAELSVYRERIRGMLERVALAHVNRGEPADALGAARLMVISDAEDLLAIRLALIGLGASGQHTVFSADGRVLLDRASAEAPQSWFARVLRAWGVERAVADVESQRFAAWRAAADSVKQP
jgi:hypothetical protein